MEGVVNKIQYFPLSKYERQFLHAHETGAAELIVSKCWLLALSPTYIYSLHVLASTFSQHNWHDWSAAEKIGTFVIES